MENPIYFNLNTEEVLYQGKLSDIDFRKLTNKWDWDKDDIRSNTFNDNYWYSTVEDYHFYNLYEHDVKREIDQGGLFKSNIFDIFYVVNKEY